MSIAVLTTYFNPQHSSATLRNYYRFRQGMHRIGVQVFTAELVFDEDPLEIHDATVKLRGTRARHLLWQKEVLLNILVREVRVDVIAWLDADVLLLNDEWASTAERTISAMGSVVQLFSEAYFADEQGRLSHKRGSSTRLFREGSPLLDDFTQAHPGLAWAAPAALLAEHGLYDSMVTGSNDTIMLRAFTGTAALKHMHRTDAAFCTHASDWMRLMGSVVRGNVNFVHGAAVHLYHGPMESRGYEDRWSALAHFDPSRDVRRESSGLLAWTPAASEALRATTARFIAHSRA